LVTFLVGHRKQKIPSPALLNKMTQRFVQDIKQYAEENDIPFVHFKHGQRKDDIANQMRPAVAG
jgi:2-oxo-4-hydroxy-4-carboxy--5-ureidoimidazoline (OHCU) decarboxylase